MIVPIEPEHSKKYEIVIGIVASLIMIIVGAQVLGAMVENMPPTEFTIVNKEYVPGDWWRGADSYYFYYNDEGCVPVNQTTYGRYQIGDWFNETVRLIYKATM